MKIVNSMKTVADVSQGACAKNGKTDSATAPGVSVKLSGPSSQLQAMGAQVSRGEVDDITRVSQIKQAISQGSFKVNADVVADRLLQTVRNLPVA